MKQKYPNYLVKKIVEKDTDHEYSLISVESQGKKTPHTIKTMKRKMLLKHNKCGHIYEIDIYEFIEGKRRCGKCKGKVLREHFVESIKSIKDKTESLTGGEYSFIDYHYINSKTKHRFKHKACGTVFKKSWNKFRIGQRCPECSRKGMESSASRYTRDIFDYLNILYIAEMKFDDCINPKTNKKLPFDYYLPEYNILIEIDGEQHERGSFSKYGHSDIQKRDAIKDKYAKKNRIKLTRIPAKKWSMLPEILHAVLSEDFRELPSP